MAQFDYHRRPDGQGFWVDCQSEWMENYQTRFVIPLVASQEAPHPSAARLNPQFEIGGRTFELLTQFAGTIPVGELALPAGSLAHERYTILNAIDFLITGV